MGNRQKLSHHEELTRQPVTMKNQFTEKKLLRRPTQTPGQYVTTGPPEYTNQFYIMAISNIFGAEAWNSYPSEYTNGVTIILSNEISIGLTNNYNFGTNMVLAAATDCPIDSWPGYGFMVPMFKNIISLPESYWSESTEQFVPIGNGFAGFLQSDLQQTGWPAHAWTLNITNNLMYALVDNNTGRVLDFVNLGAFGSSLNFNQVLTNFNSEPPAFNLWTVSPATDALNSPMSEGSLNQIAVGEEQSPEFLLSLLGLHGGFPSTVGLFSAPYVIQGGVGENPATANFIQSCSWQAGNPMVHYTDQDLTNPEFNQDIQDVPLEGLTTALASSMSNSVCSLGRLNPGYNSGAVDDFYFDLSDGSFEMGFSGAADLPYEVWASTDLIDWRPLGTATQPSSGCFQFDDSSISNYPARYYQVRLP
jgi:hypothetical protein